MAKSRRTAPTAADSPSVCSSRASRYEARTKESAKTDASTLANNPSENNQSDGSATAHGGRKPPPRSVASPSLWTKPLGHQHSLQEALRQDVSNDQNRPKPRSSRTGQNERYILTLSVLSSFLMRKKLILMTR